MLLRVSETVLRPAPRILIQEAAVALGNVVTNDVDRVRFEVVNVGGHFGYFDSITHLSIAHHSLHMIIDCAVVFLAAAKLVHYVPYANNSVHKVIAATTAGAMLFQVESYSRIQADVKVVAEEKHVVGDCTVGVPRLPINIHIPQRQVLCLAGY